MVGVAKSSLVPRFFAGLPESCTEENQEPSSMGKNLFESCAQVAESRGCSIPDPPFRHFQNATRGGQRQYGYYLHSDACLR